jgi:hypothetical protein
MDEGDDGPNGESRKRNRMHVALGNTAARSREAKR